MKRALLIVALAVTLAFGAAPAGAILNGQPDGTNHPYVGLIWDVCSGAAISPTKLVTAAHCFDTGPGTDVFVTFDPDGLAGFPATFVSGEWFPHPEWCNACGSGLVGFDQNDVGVVLLDDPVALTEYAKLPALGQAAGLPQKTGVSLVGYGIQDRLKTLDPGEFLTRHFAPAQLVQSNNRISSDFVKVTANPSKGKGAACFADSGGPVLLEGAGLGNDTIVGVNSFGSNVNCAGVGYANRLDIVATLDFVNGVD